MCSVRYSDRYQHSLEINHRRTKNLKQFVRWLYRAYIIYNKSLILTLDNITLVSRSLNFCIWNYKTLQCFKHNYDNWYIIFNRPSVFTSFNLTSFYFTSIILFCVSPPWSVTLNFIKENYSTAIMLNKHNLIETKQK